MSKLVRLMLEKNKKCSSIYFQKNGSVFVYNGTLFALLTIT